jgi:3-oxoacyl-[acyl-carrier protein] reductase
MSQTLPRTALVTGASRGIGRGIAESLARQGFGLTITSRKPVELASLAVELEALGAPKVVHMAAEMAARESLPSLVELHDTTFGAMSALVLSAGVGTAGNVAEFPVHRIDKTLEVNLVSAIVLIQNALPLLRAGAEQDPEHGSTIVGLSSITGTYAEPGLAVYGASKAGLISLLQTVNLEESANGVKATALAPGYVDTDMSAWTNETIPADVMIRVSDIVAVVDMLVALGRTATIPSMVVSRSGSNGYEA